MAGLPALSNTRHRIVLCHPSGVLQLLIPGDGTPLSFKCNYPVAGVSVHVCTFGYAKRKPFLIKASAVYVLMFYLKQHRH